MTYIFPRIDHINDVLPHIEGRKEFIVVEKPGFKVINYVISTPDTFPSIYEQQSLTLHYKSEQKVFNLSAAILRECRGIKFCSETGFILQRPLHKFFNLNENEDSVLYSDIVALADKLDGSMVSPIKLTDSSGDTHIRWTTKMGITDTAKRAEVFIAQNPEYTKFAEIMLAADQTPIFEWCSNKDRIVIGHPEDSLVLLAGRQMKTGNYVFTEVLEALGKLYNIPVVNHTKVDYTTQAEEYWDNKVKHREDTEGIIAIHNNGHRVKLKTPWYVKLHKAKSLTDDERNVTRVILDENLDDILSCLDGDLLDKVKSFANKLGSRVVNLTAELEVEAKKHIENCGGDKKAFALSSQELDPFIKMVVFKCIDYDLDRNNIADLVKRQIYKSLTRRESYSEMKTKFKLPTM